MKRLRTPLALGLALAFASTIAVAAVVAHDLSGRWAFSVVTENGTGTPTVTIKQAGEKISGTYESRMMGIRSIEGTVKGDSLRFVLSNDGSADAVTMTFLGVALDADHLKGIVDFGGMGSANFTATREKAKP